MIEAIKLARADRLRFPANEPGADWASLLDEAHVAELRARIDPQRAAESAGEWYSSAAAAAEVAPRHTTHLVTADGAGNLVSFTATLGWLFGGAVVAGDTGVLLNDMCYFFDLDPASPNAIGPRRRQGSPIAPIVALASDGGTRTALGTPGGFGILQTTAQMLSNMVDFGMNPQTALESPRIRVDEGRYVAVESRIADEALAGLAERGHECDLVGPWMSESVSGRADIGRGSIVVRDAALGMLHTGADPRGDGFALAV